MREDRSIRSHHDCPPSNTKGRQENPRSYLKRNNSRGRLEDGVRDEEDQSRDRVSVTFVGLQIIVHACDCGVWPGRALEVGSMSVVGSVGAYILPLSMSETQYINLEEDQSACRPDIVQDSTLKTYPSMTTNRLSIR